MNFFKKLTVLSFLMFLSLSVSWGETEKDPEKESGKESKKESVFSWDTKKFHLGFGVTITTGNLLGLIENAKLYNPEDYKNPGMTEEEENAVNQLNKGMLNTLMVANILATMQYGFRTRIMYHVLISDTDLIFLICDGSYNGRFDFQVVPTIGVRLPWFVMPYITAGPSFTFSFYPDKVTNIENWKTNSGYGVFDRFVFRVGLNTRIGVDLNFRKITFGAFYQYEIKDFAEFTDYHQSMIDRGFTSADASGRIFGYQSRFGVSIVIKVM